MEMLLNSGAYINGRARTKHGQTARYPAVMAGHGDAVRLLEKRGAGFLFNAGPDDINSVLFGSGLYGLCAVGQLYLSLQYRDRVCGFLSSDRFESVGTGSRGYVVTWAQ